MVEKKPVIDFLQLAHLNLVFKDGVYMGSAVGNWVLTDLFADLTEATVNRVLYDPPEKLRNDRWGLYQNVESLVSALEPKATELDAFISMIEGFGYTRV